MIQTIKFRIYPDEIQERKLHEIFTIYNRVKRVGYNLLFHGEDYIAARFGEDKSIQQCLMDLCHNNPYVNTILNDSRMKLEQQKTWLKKRRTRMTQQLKVINKKLNEIKEQDTHDRRLKGLYARRSSIMAKLYHLQLEPVVFGTKKLFRDRIRGNITREEFRIRRDSSFSCIGKKQKGRKNLNIKILHDKTVKIRTFSKQKEHKWLVIPTPINSVQEKWFQQILNADKYTVTVKRKLFKGRLRYFVHVSYEIPELAPRYGYEHGAIGLDFNYNFAALTNVDQHGTLLSYHSISFGNLHSYRTDKRNDYISYKMDKIVNYCINKGKGIVVEDLQFEQEFSYNTKRNRKLSNMKTTALQLLERKCKKRGVSFRKVFPGYTSVIGKYKYSGLHNLSVHHLASYVIARRGLGFKEAIPTVYDWMLSHVGEFIEPRVKQSSPYHSWSMIHDLFEHSGITSFKTAEILKKTVLMK
ncbi:IS200/IS605 family accessory protein TnpB-related protein, partial [Candidatus Borrarchaeum sp.]|uniref:IS200/IS605 family accessory protein TnpB-related protein n=1 Tax=Candidatus Borrarchaeum sp. TaxID=2846742 RepID=UPI00257DB9E2